MFELTQLPLAPLALAAIHWAFIIPLCLLSIFLILLVLVQRGRGGGLTGALGGMGGQSAFGAKAGDLFTKITIVTALLWIMLAMLGLKLLHKPRLSGGTTATPAVNVPADPAKGGLTPDTVPAPTTKGEPAKEPAKGETGSTPAAPAEPPAAPATPPAPPATPPATPDKTDDK